MGEEEAARPLARGRWSLWALVVHLRGWQQLSVARVAAALEGAVPGRSAWAVRLSESWEEESNASNERLLAAAQGQPWQAVRAAWQQTFERLTSLAGRVPPQRREGTAQLPWLQGYPLRALLAASLEHHQEHWADLEG